VILISSVPVQVANGLDVLLLAHIHRRALVVVQLRRLRLDELPVEFQSCLVITYGSWIGV
jgi:hypothetical protein